MSERGTVFLRLGYTETTLLFHYWCTKYSGIDFNVLNETKPSLITWANDTRHILINWLYSTSGFYDKTMSGSYFDFKSSECLTSTVYQQYMESVLNMLTKDTEVILQFHNNHEDWEIYKTAFLDYLSERVRSYSKFNMPLDIIFSKLAGKRVLIVNPMSSLMKQQYESGNVKKINPTFPDLLSIDSLENPYTFFNTGPHQSIFETAESICSEIDKRVFDIAIVSCGAYSSLISNHIHNIHGKDVICIGGNLQTIFGIITSRHSANAQNEHNEYWISVPEHLKPVNYMKIENGCYW
jgi:hypothetical protein